MAGPPTFKAVRGPAMFYYPALSALITKAPTIEAVVMIVMRRLLFLPVLRCSFAIRLHNLGFKDGDGRPALRFGKN